MWDLLIKRIPFRLDGDSWSEFYSSKFTRSISSYFLEKGFMTTLFSALASSKSIQVVWIDMWDLEADYAKLEPESVREGQYNVLAKLISENTSIKHLFVHEVEFTIEEGKLVAQAIQKNETIEILDFYTIWETDGESSFPILEAISYNTTVKIFRIPKVKSTRTSLYMKHLIPIVSNHTPCRLQILDLVGINYAECIADFQLFCTELESNTSIHTLAIRPPDEKKDQKIFDILSQLLDRNFTLHRICWPSLAPIYHDIITSKLGRNYRSFLLKRSKNLFLQLQLISASLIRVPFDLIQLILNIYVDLCFLENPDEYGLILYHYGHQTYPFSSKDIFEDEYFY